MSSDEELSIFNRSLKTPCSEREGTEESLTPEAWRKALETASESEDLPVQAPTYEYVKLSQESGSYRGGTVPFKSSMPKLAETDASTEATSPRIFNRRLLSMSSVTSDDGKSKSSVHDLVPRDLIPSLDDFDEGDDPLAHSGSSFGHSDSSLGKSSSSLRTVISSVVAESLGFDLDDIEDHSFVHDESLDEGIIDIASERSPMEIIEEFTKKQQQEGPDNRDMVKAAQEKNKNKASQNEEDDLVSQMLPSEAPTLAIEKVDFIDLDLLIDAFPERSVTENRERPSAKGDVGSGKFVKPLVHV